MTFVNPPPPDICAFGILIISVQSGLHLNLILSYRIISFKGRFFTNKQVVRKQSHKTKENKSKKNQRKYKKDKKISDKHQRQILLFTRCERVLRISETN